MLVFLLPSMLTLMINIQSVKSELTETVYIKADGSIDPQGAPLITYDNVTYTLTGNILSSGDGIVIERDNIILDGNDYMLSGNHTGRGIDLSNRTNVTIKNITIKNFQTGIWLFNSRSNNIYENHLIANQWYSIYLNYSSNSNITQNIIEKNRCGICLLYSSKNNVIQSNKILANNESGIYFGEGSSLNSISENNLTSNLQAIYLEFSCNNTIFGNHIANNEYGVLVRQSNNNMFFHNNFINNSHQVFDQNWDPFSSISINVWDNCYPSGGNYWSEYACVDLFGGLYQNETGSDGICDSPYRIDENNQDNYPLMGMFYNFEVAGLDSKTYYVQVISNSTVSELNLVVLLSSPNEYLQPGQEFLLFYVEGENDTSGFCRITIPRALLNDSYIVLVDWKVVPAHQLDASNSTHAYLYFTYNHTKHEVIIIPEFTLTIVLPLFLTATMIANLPLPAKAKIKTKNHANPPPTTIQAAKSINHPTSIGQSTP